MRDPEISIIYANRNRDSKRIEATLNSLGRQSHKNFEIIFVDYGSDAALVSEYKDVIKKFDFVRVFYLEVQQLLWNKSKALNYGIEIASAPFIFIADVDLIFHPDACRKFDEIKDTENFHLFQLGYLNQEESENLEDTEKVFKGVKPSRKGSVNGMLLAPKEALLNINGLDEFFHFYGAEDEDLFARLENAGYTRKQVDDLYFYHNWHPSFSAADDKRLTSNPRVRNIMRTNQQHFFRNRERGLTKPLRQKGMGNIVEKEESNLLDHPTKYYVVSNIRAKVEHFLGEELASLTGEIVHVEFLEDPYYHTLKHKVKRILRKQTQPYCSLKEVNDMLLKEILFRYRDHNYFFKVSEDLKTIVFKIKL